MQSKLIHVLKKTAYSLPPSMCQTIKRTYFRTLITHKKFRSYEPEYDLLPEWIEPGYTVLDVGANVGHYTLRLSMLVGPEGRVFAFEPCPENFELLAANVMLSPYRNVSLFNVAAGKATDKVSMVVPSIDGFENRYQCNVSDLGDMEVLCLPIDSLCSGMKVALAKIDVEGYELQVLQGMENLIDKHRPRLIIEGNSPQVEHFLKSYGYQFEEIPDSPNRIFFSSAIAGYSRSDRKASRTFHGSTTTTRT